MKKLLSVLVILLFILSISCEKEGDGSLPGPDDSENPKDLAIRDSLDKAYQNLGSGYDVFENYADVIKVKGHILDLLALHNDHLLEKKLIEKGTFQTVEGRHVEEYLHNFSSRTNVSGSYGFFSGSLSVNYEKSQYSSLTNSFATVQSLINKQLFQIKKEYNTEDLKEYLLDKFEEDINDPNLSSDDIFSTYGTHCMRSIIVGGRLDFSVTANQKYVQTGYTIGAHARAAFKSMFGSASIESDLENSEEQSTFNSHMEKKLEVYGGSSQYGQNIINDEDYTAWISSISEENHVFCEYGDDPFIPVWEFCEDQARSDELESAFEDWAENRQYSVNMDKMTIEYPFADSSFGMREGDYRGGGDGHPATERGPVSVVSRVKLIVNKEANVDVELYFRLKEHIDNWTEYKGKHTLHNLYDGDLYDIVGIEGDTSCYCAQVLYDATYGWTDFESKSPFIENFQFQADHKNTGNMDNRAGIRGTLKFSVFVDKNE